METKKKTLHIDMDRTICDFDGAYNESLLKNPEVAYPQSQVDFFRKLNPIPGALGAFDELSKHYDVWILTRPSINNPISYMEKRLWVEDHLGLHWCEKLIMAPDKALIKGSYLVDDYNWSDFEGELLLFGGDDYPDWKTVLNYLLDEKKY